MAFELVSVTTIREGNQDNPIEKVRAQVFLDTARNHQKLGVKLLAIYMDCSDEYLAKLAHLNVILVSQQTNGMGSVRREALDVARTMFADAKYFLWTEPEKPSMVAMALSVLADSSVEKPTVRFFNRSNLNSYPPEQAHYYLFVRSVANHLLGFDLDYGFGPIILTRMALSFFLEYDGEYGDLWDALLIPRLRIIKSGTPYVVKTIDFINDARMTMAESGNPQMILKRVHQLQNVVPSLMKEWAKLSVY